ncbi:hypothetical protein H311_02034, partial [Anncaliia algerae PRA109]
KAHRGRAPRDQIWVFGIVDTSFVPAKDILKIVLRRAANTLLPLLQWYVLHGTIIHGDEWSAYGNINSLGYVHKTICHKYEFVNKTNGVHTQHIESYWNKQKNRIKKMMGCKGSVLQENLDMFVFYDLHQDDIYNSLLILLKFDLVFFILYLN